MEQNGNYKTNMIVDLSPFFYFEAAGDSEGDLDQYHNPHNHHHPHSMMMMVGLGGHDNEEDDAQSCSYDAWDVHDDDAWDNVQATTPSHINNINEGINSSEACIGTTTHRTSTIIGHHHHHSYKHDDDDDDDDDDGILLMESRKKMMNNSKKASSYSREDYKCTSSEVMSTANSNSSRKSCIDASDGKKLSEKERSRLFWETCLAS